MYIIIKKITKKSKITLRRFSKLISFIVQYYTWDMEKPIHSIFSACDPFILSSFFRIENI